jgi:hypothetical protein
MPNISFQPSNFPTHPGTSPVEQLIRLFRSRGTGRQCRHQSQLWARWLRDLGDGLVTSRKASEGSGLVSVALRAYHKQPDGSNNHFSSSACAKKQHDATQHCKPL